MPCSCTAGWILPSAPIASRIRVPSVPGSNATKAATAIAVTTSETTVIVRWRCSVAGTAQSSPVTPRVLTVAAWNTFIEGDNLDVLPTLGEGLVDLVYIDPPYNTGNEFAYADSYASHAA